MRSIPLIPALWTVAKRWSSSRFSLSALTASSRARVSARLATLRCSSAARAAAAISGGVTWARFATKSATLFCKRANTRNSNLTLLSVCAAATRAVVSNTACASFCMASIFVRESVTSFSSASIRALLSGEMPSASAASYRFCKVASVSANDFCSSAIFGFKASCAASIAIRFSFTARSTACCNLSRCSASRSLAASIRTANFSLVRAVAVGLGATRAAYVSIALTRLLFISTSCAAMALALAVAFAPSCFSNSFSLFVASTHALYLSATDLAALYFAFTFRSALISSAVGTRGSNLPRLVPTLGKAMLSHFVPSMPDCASSICLLNTAIASLRFFIASE